MTPGTITVRRCALEDIPALSALATRVFDRDVAPHYSDAGCATYHHFASAETMTARAASSAWWVAEAGGQPVGMLELRDGSHVAMLFVDGPYQRQGLARRLLEAALGPPDGWKTLTVNSAPNAIGAYERLGFVPAEPEREQAGMRFVPMRREQRSGRS